MTRTGGGEARDERWRKDGQEARGQQALLYQCNAESTGISAAYRQLSIVSTITDVLSTGETIKWGV